ncbi:SAM-dependent methyltransferase [Methylobacterium sp. BE186]|uniref:class I SAM-dependent methyltransferase n=1 Tax=Methylobacterium sp. BE186 TaxID=2817715 RepID=UPI002862FEBB|nr:class I SAM-dependent methyltransferase [Methylobacterium sp. BE186]MDR7036064.1 SAM-dependent methyltransferase [Methylobacterium sp. BE186]
MTPPPCPITGEPARRLVQWVSAKLLVELWHRILQVDVRPSFAGTTRFGLWESPTGLYFFDPMLEGDASFYNAFYRVLDDAEPRGLTGRLRRLATALGLPSRNTPRAEFRLAANHLSPGDSVLDVGCGPGVFRHLVPGGRYTGLDPHFGADPGQPWASPETLSEHLRSGARAYDVVSAFQVLEHVARPVAFLSEMAQAVRPGGTVIVGVPHVPSAATRIPNYLVNALPHHLTWWTAEALRAIAARVGLVDAQVETIPWSELDNFIYWMARCSPVKCQQRHYAHRWSWHASALLGLGGALAIQCLRRAPPINDEGVGLLLVARKPGG